MQTFFAENGTDLLIKTAEHIFISGSAILLAVIVAVSLGVLLSRVPKFADKFISVVGLLQTIPSLAMLAFFIPILGVGKLPAIVALFVYGLLPILRNTYIGMTGVSNDVIEAGKGMGMNNRESIFKIELPLALPVIMAGIRLTTVYLIGWATLAAFIGGGGLGDFVFDGMNLYRIDLIFAGTIPATILALVAALLISWIEKALTPKGYRESLETT